MKCKFETRLTRNDGTYFEAIVKVGNDGWGAVYDKQDELYCGSLSPYRVQQLRKAVGK